MKQFKVCFMGGNQAGIVGALTVLSHSFTITAAVSYTDNLTLVLKYFKIPIFNSVKDVQFYSFMKNADLLICVHGREILDDKLLKMPRIGCFNVHPYLYKYKGANPIEKALRDKNFRASVGVHRMETAVDSGENLVEEFVDVKGLTTVEEIYNKLYPYYCLALSKALAFIEGR